MQGCQRGCLLAREAMGLGTGRSSLRFPGRSCLTQGRLGGRRRAPSSQSSTAPALAPGAWANVGPATSLGTERPPLALGSRWPRSTRSLSRTLQGLGRGAGLSLLGQHTACPPDSSPRVGLKLRVRGASAAGAREGGGEPSPLLWEPSLCKQQLDGVARVAPWGQGQRVEEMSRLADGGLLLAGTPASSEVRPVLLQLLIVSGNCKKLWEGKGRSVPQTFLRGLGVGRLVLGPR